MDKKETIDFLNACIDAEQGVYETDRLIGEINNKIYEIEGKNYESGKVLPKPKMEDLVFNEPEPELYLEHDEELEKEIKNLRISTTYFKKSQHRRTLLFLWFVVLGLAAACAFSLWALTWEPVWSAIDNFVDNHTLITLLLPLALFVIGKFFLDDYPAVEVCFMVPFIWFVVCGIVALTTDLFRNTSDRLEICIYFYPIILCVFVCLIGYFVRMIPHEKSEIRSGEVDIARLKSLEEEMAEQKKKNELITEEYNRRMAEYEERKKIALEGKKAANIQRNSEFALKVKNATMLDKVTVRTLNVEKKRLEERNAEFVKKRGQLYSRYPIYGEFKDAIVLTQIKKYLEMGVANELEGPDGAIKMYLDDKNTDRIISSVESLRHTIEAGITVLANGQEAIFNEMIVANRNLSSLSYDLDANLKKINHSIFGMKFDLEEAIKEEGRKNRDAISSGINRAIEYSSEAYSSQLQEIVDSQKNLLDTVEKSAYNQYLVAKMENVDNYIYSSLRDPR